MESCKLLLVWQVYSKCVDLMAYTLLNTAPGWLAGVEFFKHQVTVTDLRCVRPYKGFWLCPVSMLSLLLLILLLLLLLLLSSS